MLVHTEHADNRNDIKQTDSIEWKGGVYNISNSLYIDSS